MKKGWSISAAIFLCCLLMGGCSWKERAEDIQYGVKWLWAGLAPEYATYPEEDSAPQDPEEETAEELSDQAPEGLPLRSERERLAREAARELTAAVTLPEMSAYEKEKAVHDALTARVAYDSREPLPEVSHTAYGALVLGTGVCDAYAYAFQMCMEELGIPSLVVTGNAESGGRIQSHAWNMVQLDGDWYHVDVTWDDVEGSAPSYEYFNVTTAAISQNHFDFQAPEAGAETYNYYRRSGLLAETPEEFAAKAQALMAEGQRGIVIYCENFRPEQSLVETFIWNYCSRYTMNWSYGGYIYTVTLTLQ